MGVVGPARRPAGCWYCGEEQRGAVRCHFPPHSKIVVGLGHALEISDLPQFVVADTDAVNARIVCPFGIEVDGLSILRKIELMEASPP